MSKVSRSVYQKLKEENKRLKADIKVLVEGNVFDFIEVKRKWKEIFKKETDFNNMMKEYAEDYFRKHPEQDVRNKVSANINGKTEKERSDNVANGNST